MWSVYHAESHTNQFKVTNIALWNWKSTCKNMYGRKPYYFLTKHRKLR